MENKTPKEQLIKMAYKAGEISRQKKEQRIAEYNKNPKFCKQCGKPIEYAKRINTFCSGKCSTTFSNIHRAIKSTDDTSYGFCKHCGKPIIKRNGESYLKVSNRHFCNNECRVAYEYDEYIKSWKNNKVSGLTGGDQIHPKIKKYLLEKADYKCEKCGWSEINPYTKNIPLQVHHIDGNYQNNNEENLQVLCPNCHSLTSTFGSLNKGNGRGNRRRNIGA